MVKVEDKEKVELYLTAIDTLWKHASCVGHGAGAPHVIACACSKAHETIKKLITELEKVVLSEEK